MVCPVAIVTLNDIHKYIGLWP